MMVHFTTRSGDIQLGSVFQSMCPTSRVVHDEPLLLSWPGWEPLSGEYVALSKVWLRNGSDAWKERGAKVTSQIVAVDSGLREPSRVL